MDSDLKTLEEKLLQLMLLCQKLRSENLELRQDLAQEQNETKQLKENMVLASAKLEALIARLPHGNEIENAMNKVAL